MKQTKDKRFFYSNGLHFTDDIKKNVDRAIQRVFIKGKASLIIVDGVQGEGKTTLATQIAEYVSNSQKKEFLMDLQYSRGGEQFKEKLAKCYTMKLPGLVYDEAGDFDRKGSMTRYNRDLNQVFQQFRTFKIVVICCLPHFKIIDGSLFTNGIPRMLFHCHDKKKKYSRAKGYSMVRMNKMLHLMRRKNIPANEIYKKVYPNFRGSFKDFEPEMSKKLDVLSSTEKFLFLMENQEKLTQDQLAEKLDRSKNWVYKMLKKKKLSEVLIHKRKKFYDKKALEKLQIAIEKGEGC